MRERTLKDGTTTYQVLYRHGGRQTSTTFGDRKSAEKFESLVTLLGPKRALAELQTVAGARTLDQVAEEFWDYKQTRVRSQRTIDDYKRIYKNWVKDQLGWMPIGDIDALDVQNWVDEIAEELAPKTIAGHHAMLHGIIKFALSPARSYIDADPCAVTELPARIKKAPKRLTAGEWSTMHAALVSLDQDAADLAEFLIASGWRFSEAIALPPEAVEVDEKGWVWIAVEQVARRDSKGRIDIVEDAKSQRGKRRMRLDPDAGELVVRRAVAANGGLVFTTRYGAIWNYSHFRSRYWDPARIKAGLTRKPTPHWLRHGAVARFHESGMDLVEIQRRIGHESITTTFDVYGSMIDGASDKSLKRLAKQRRPKGAVASSGAPYAIES